jgi:hypothetical protein
VSRGNLSGAWAKWERAQTHLQSLDPKDFPSITFTNEWLRHYPTTSEAHRDGLEYRFYVEPETLDTESWAILAGDCLFNLRCALDHIVFELHHQRFRGKIPPAVEEASGFPILTTKPTGRRGRSPDPAKWREIKHLASKQRRAIEFLQPYNRQRDKFRNVRNALADIQTLNNIDKHRHLHVLEAVAFSAPVPSYAWGGDWDFDAPPQYGFDQQSFLARPLIGKTEVFRWTFNTVPPDIADELNKNYDITAGIGLNEGGEFRFFLSSLRFLVESVATVLKRFEVFLPAR